MPGVHHKIDQIRCFSAALAAGFLCLPIPSFAQQAQVLVPVFEAASPTALIREGDNIRADVGTLFSMRCALIDANGNEVGQFPNGEALAEAQPELRLTRGPQNGLSGTLDAAGSEVRLRIAGLYVFTCVAGNSALLGNIQTPVRVAVGQSISIGRSEVQLSDAESGAPLRSFEVGRPFDVHAKVFSASRPSELVQPTNVDILFREGSADCGTGGTQANGAFSFRLAEAWSSQRGSVQEFTPQRAGRFTAVINQLDGQGGNRCDAIAFSVEEDLYPPQISLRFPDSTNQMRWDRDLLRISGRVSDTGSEIVSVTVSNGHWSEEARLFDLPAEGEWSFFSDLPFARGLQIITITARDAAGRETKMMESLYVGEHFSQIRTGPPDPGAFSAVRFLSLQAGRSLVRNSEPGIDSLSEIADFAPEILSLFDGLDALAPTRVNQDIDHNFVEDVRNLIKPDFQARGTIVPGRLDVSVANSSVDGFLGGALSLRVRIPFTGDVLMICDGVSFGWERLLCLAGGSPSGQFNVSVGGSVTATIPVQVTTIGGTAIHIRPHDMEIENNILVRNGLSNNADINEAFKNQVGDTVQEAVTALVWSLWNCPDSPDPAVPCTPEDPLITEPGTQSQDRPETLGILINNGQGQFAFEASLPGVFDTPAGAGFIVLDPDRASIDGGRLSTVLNTSLQMLDVQEVPDGVLGALLDAGTLTPGQQRFLPPPDPLPIFGSGSHDVMALVHLNLINELVAQYWASGALDYRENLFTVLSAANFFDDNPVLKPFAEVAFANADLVVKLGAPPRITAYDGARGLFAEVGDVSITLDMTEGFDSLIELEAAFISRISLQSTGTGLSVSLSDPTGCSPSPNLFMACDGRFELGVKRVEGFAPDGPRPSLLNSEALYNQFLVAVGIRSEGEFPLPRAATQISAFYTDALGSAVAGFLGEEFVFDIPSIPLPRIDLGRLQLAPLKISDIELHPNRDGGRPAEGWIGVEFNLRAELE